MPGNSFSAYIHTGRLGPDEKHPVLKWMYDYAATFDSKAIFTEWEKWHTTSWQYSKANGQIFSKGQESRDAITQDYSMFVKYHHEPYFAVVYELENGSGYALSGNAWLFVNLPNGGGNTSHTDENGNSWEMKIPAGFYFVYKKDGDSLKLDSTAITSDSGPIVLELLKRGVLKPADLGL